MTAIDLSKRLREVTGLHSFVELFGFSWEDGSDWVWHDVVCAMADAVDAATVGAVPETKYLMALDEALEEQRKLEMCQTSQKVYQSKCRSLKETNADLCRIIGELKAATADAGTCEWCKDGKTFDKQTVMMTNHGWQKIRHCPNCGRRLVSE